MTIFLSVDGDRVGAKLEALLITEKLEEATSFSVEVASATLRMTKLIEHKNGIIIFAGGDNLLAKFDDSESTDSFIDEIKDALNKIFFEATNCTISIGLGNRPRDAYLALKLAKGSDKEKFIDLRNSF